MSPGWRCKQTAKLWKDRLQAASFFHNMSAAQQREGGETQYAQKREGSVNAVTAGEAGLRHDEWGNRLPQAAEHASNLLGRNPELAAAAAPPPNVHPYLIARDAHP
jgi:hypothetical protein